MSWFDGGFRTDPDGRYAEDKKVQPVKTYKMSPEELEKYITVSYKKPSMAGIKTQARKEKNVMSIEAQKVQEVENVENVEIATNKNVSTKRLSKEIIKEEFKSGMTAAQIAEKHGKKEYWVYGEMVKYGLVEKRTKSPITSRKKKIDIVEMLKAEPAAATKFYISSGYENKTQVKRLSNLLEKMGFQNTFDWTSVEESIQAVAEKELEGIRESNIVAVVLTGEYGTHVELGVALALVKKVILWSNISPEQCIFYKHPSVKIVYDVMEFIETILDMKGV